MKKRAIFFVLVVVLISGLVLGGCQTIARKTATGVAREYVNENFYQEMQFVRTIIPVPIADGTRNRSYFHPTDNPELVFRVEMMQGTHNVTGDSYYSAYFELRMRDFFAPYIEGIWGADAFLDVSVLSSNRMRLQTPAGFDRKQPIAESLEEMASVFYSASLDRYSFDFNIHIPRTIENETDKAEEADRIFEFIEILGSSTFKPNSLNVNYDKPHPRLFDRIFNDTQIEIKIRAWYSIENVEQVKNLVKLT